MASAPPAIIGAEPTWVPYEPTRDCSQGLCSLYCPQWCYFIFPPPPPYDLAGPGPGPDDDSSGHVFSPLVIAIIGVLATAFLLVSYYTFISKYCGTFTSLRARLFGSGSGAGPRGGGGSGHGQSRSQESWNVSPSSGLDQTLINKIAVCKYRRGDGSLHHTTDCSVCLGEFHDGESLRLLPKCSHAFHQQCIDTWLKSHSNCPLCRSNITFAAAVEVVPPEPQGRAPGDDDRSTTHEVVIAMDELENMCEEQQQDAVSSGVGNTDRGDQETEDSLREAMEEANVTAEIREEGVAPKTTGANLNLQRDSRMSIADVLQSTMEDELIAARESGLLAGGAGTSSRRCRGENSNGRGRNRRALQDGGVDSVPMKRLPPGGKSCFSSKSGRGVDSDNSVRGGGQS